MANKLEGADRPWFIWVKSGRHCGLRPHSGAGWLLTFLYTVAAVGLSLFLLARDDPGALALTAWGLLLVALTSAFLLIAWRTSSTVVRKDSRGRNRPQSGNPVRTLVLALLSAIAIIGAALFGAEL